MEFVSSDWLRFGSTVGVYGWGLRLEGSETYVLGRFRNSHVGGGIFVRIPGKNKEKSIFLTSGRIFGQHRPNFRARHVCVKCFRAEHVSMAFF